MKLAWILILVVSLSSVLQGRAKNNIILSHLDFTGTGIYLNATNILTFTKYTGRDPESPTVSEPLNPANDNGTYPLPRAITTGIQIDF